VLPIWAIQQIKDKKLTPTHSLWILRIPSTGGAKKCLKNLKFTEIPPIFVEQIFRIP